MDPQKMQEQMQKQQEAVQKQEMVREQRAAVMQQVLENDARIRLSNIAAVKPEKAAQLENIIIGNMQRGTINGKINESQLIDLLNQFSEKESEAASKVDFKRKAFDSDDDLDLDNLDL
uniref:Programmed cell death protein 5 n=1 Tax=Strombidium rassoulzadegani TaxID=1082188 RepID=A0A7S3FTF1_9SPIT|mmetsp:Transcript_13205/g.22401  ORF Transcript_13205/g.22401 Transcript_13205/m.22401 type:complete len:118 (+) Transcript_13205:25-378(+)